MCQCGYGYGEIVIIRMGCCGGDLSGPSAGGSLCSLYTVCQSALCTLYCTELLCQQVTDASSARRDSVTSATLVPRGLRRRFAAARLLGI